MILAGRLEREGPAPQRTRPAYLAAITLFLLLLLLSADQEFPSFYSSSCCCCCCCTGSLITDIWRRMQRPVTTLTRSFQSPKTFISLVCFTENNQMARLKSRHTRSSVQHQPIQLIIDEPKQSKAKQQTVDFQSPKWKPFINQQTDVLNCFN